MEKYHLMVILFRMLMRFPVVKQIEETQLFWKNINVEILEFKHILALYKVKRNTFYIKNSESLSHYLQLLISIYGLYTVTHLQLIQGKSENKFTSIISKFQVKS